MARPMPLLPPTTRIGDDMGNGLPERMIVHCDFAANPVASVGFLPKPPWNPHCADMFERLSSLPFLSGLAAALLLSGCANFARLADDLGEKTNLAKQYPERVEAMTKDLNEWKGQMMKPLWGEAKKWFTVHWVKEKKFA